MKKISILFKLLIPALIILLAGPGCSDRPRSNPLDPNNPDRDQTNAGFNALAGNGQVLLVWEPLDYEDLEGILVQRFSSESTDTVVLNDSILSPGTTYFLDNSATNGVSYSYNLQFVLKSDPEMPTTLPDIATPGEIFGWMELYDYGELVLMTPDFKDEIRRLEAAFFNIQDIQIDPSNQELWILDRASQEIYRYTVKGEPIGEGAALSSVAAFAFSRTRRKVWVAMTGNSGMLYQFQLGSGELLSTESTNLPVTSIAVDNLSGDIWVGSSEPVVARVKVNEGKVVHYSHSEFVAPEGVVLGEQGAGVWIFDSGSRRVFLFEDEEIVSKTATFSDPTSLTVNIAGDICWASDYGSDMVYEIDRSGAFTAQIPNLGRPWSLSYSEYDNTVYASSESGLITKFAPGGEIIWQVQHPDKPGIIALHNPLQTGPINLSLSVSSF